MNILSCETHVKPGSGKGTERTSSVPTVEMRAALRKIVYSDQAARKEVELVERCAAGVNFLLAVFHREKMARFEVEDRRTILRTMPPKARQVWRQIV